MSEQPISPATRTAANKAFIRTTLQGYEGILAAGLGVNFVLALVRGEVDLLTLGVTAVVTLVSPPIAGLSAWLGMLAKGVPAEYTAARADPPSARAP